MENNKQTFSQRFAKRDNGSDQIIRVHTPQGLIFEKPFPSGEEIRRRIEQRRNKNNKQRKENIERTTRERENDKYLFLFI